MSEFAYKKSLKPKESHPMLPLVQQIFVTAGPDYVKDLMVYLKSVIESEAEQVDPKENLNGVIYETLRKATEGEPLNDRYLMGAALYIVASLVPVAPAMQAALENYQQVEPEAEEERSLEVVRD